MHIVVAILSTLFRRIMATRPSASSRRIMATRQPALSRRIMATRQPALFFRRNTLGLLLRGEQHRHRATRRTSLPRAPRDRASVDGRRRRALRDVGERHRQHSAGVARRRVVQSVVHRGLHKNDKHTESTHCVACRWASRCTRWFLCAEEYRSTVKLFLILYCFIRGTTTVSGAG